MGVEPGEGSGAEAGGRPVIIGMNVCFRGGAGDSRTARSIGAIRGLAKNVRTPCRLHLHARIGCCVLLCLLISLSLLCCAGAFR